jgi:serine/threonine protein kinase
MSFAEGEMVGPYRVVGQLGQGGMATVFKAYHAALDRYVAIKVLHPAFLEDSSFQARFQREARLVARLEHPNIVPIYDYAEHEGRPYLVMKFIEGRTLKAALAAGPIGRDEVLRVVKAVGAALSYAHGQGILHRDVKPSNVLLADDGQIYLADFGLARIAQSGEASLTNDMIVGTPQYISPEQAMGKKDLDEGTDIYSLGVMLYELTVGKVPFSADTPFSIIHDHIYTPLPLPRQVNPAVSEAVERVLLKALTKERGDRYKNVHQMVQAFERAWEAGAGPGIEETATRRAEAATLLTTPSAPAIPAEAPPAPAAETPAPASASPAPASAARRTRRVPWMWLSVLVVLILGCLFTLGALRAVRRTGTVRDRTPIRQTPTSLQIPGGDPGALAFQVWIDHDILL